MKRLPIVVAAIAAFVAGAALFDLLHTRPGAPGAEPTPSEPVGWVEPANYTYRVSHMVFGPVAGTYDITVRDHRVVSIGPVDGNQRAIDEGWIGAEDGWTIADLLAEADKARSDPEARATVTFDPTTGVPDAIYLDWIVEAVDDEQGFQILAFDPTG